VHDKLFHGENMGISTRTNGSVRTMNESDSDFNQNYSKILEFVYSSAG